MSYFINLSILKRNPRFALLFTGQFTSLFGTMVTGVALPFQIYERTHSTLQVGLLSLFQLLPLLFTALIGGVLADRYHRRQLLVISESLLAIGALLLAWNASYHDAPLWITYLIASLMSAITGLHRPALDSLVQQIVDPKDFSSVGSLAMFKSTFCMIVGPAVGGILLAKTGLVVTYIVDFSTFLLSLIALISLYDLPKPNPRTEDFSAWASIKQSIKYTGSRQELLGSYLVDFAAMVFSMPNALFPAIAERLGGVQVLGLLYSAPAVGALLVSIFSGWVVHVKRHGLAITLAAMGWGVAIVLFGLSPSLILALFFLALAGAFDGISGIFRVTLWNETIPNVMRGRMAGIEMISYLSGPKLGDTRAGLVASLFGSITISVVSGGVLCVLSVALCCVFLPKFLKYHAIEHKS